MNDTVTTADCRFVALSSPCVLELAGTALPLAVIRQGTIAYANPAFLAIFATLGPLRGIPLADLVTDAACERLAEVLAAAQHAPARYFGLGRRGDGTTFEIELWLAAHALEGEPAVIAFAWDVTEHNRSREQLAYLAYIDDLTGLANRALIADRLRQAVRDARRHSATFAVLMVDLDGFKAINDTYGHEAGDVALRLVGQRFQSCVREGDTLARIGGDEFAVLLPRVSARHAAELVARRMIASLQAPFTLGADSIVIGASIGMAAWPEHAASVDPLLAAADAAMYRAKRSGRNQCRWASGRAAGDILSLAPLAWGAAHTLGVPLIDDQRMHLAGLIDGLSTALKNGIEGEPIREMLNETARYAEFHFATEEGLMEQHRIDGLSRHREEHRRLLVDLQKLQVDGDLASISLIVRYLQEWLLRHVHGLDRHLGQALIARGYDGAGSINR